MTCRSELNKFGGCNLIMRIQLKKEVGIERKRTFKSENRVRFVFACFSCSFTAFNPHLLLDLFQQDFYPAPHNWLALFCFLGELLDSLQSNCLAFLYSSFPFFPFGCSLQTLFFFQLLNSVKLQLGSLIF